ncbi:MAG: hypothetical protein M3008_01400 [Chloroflexota bacterium]|nr:hypothetical protein [Chloroflexota bacterium]
MRVLAVCIGPCSRTEYSTDNLFTYPPSSHHTATLRTLEEVSVLRARVPVLLRQVIDGRQARLGEEAQQALAVAAVSGQEIPFDLWTAIVVGDGRA